MPGTCGSAFLDEHSNLREPLAGACNVLLCWLAHGGQLRTHKEPWPWAFTIQWFLGLLVSMEECNEKQHFKAWLRTLPEYMHDALLERNFQKPQWRRYVNSDMR